MIEPVFNRREQLSVLQNLRHSRRLWLLLLWLLPVWSASAVQVSWYGEAHRGKLMANGQRFDPTKLTCASWYYPLNSVLEVEGPDHRKVRVVVTDRGPAWSLVRQGRVLDLSASAFDRLEGLAVGVIEVQIRVVRVGLDKVSNGGK